MTTWMVAYRVELTNNTSHSGSVAVSAADPAVACRKVAALIKSPGRNRPACFDRIDPHEIDDISVTCLGLGPA